jgi:hypothetical protein
MKNYTLSFLAMFFAIVTNQSQSMQSLPDFKNANYWNKKYIDGAFDFNDENVFRLLNACDVGNYKTKIYMEKNEQLYFVFETDVICFNGLSSDVIMTQAKKMLYSSTIPILAPGRWWVVIPNVRCGYVFKFDVTKEGKVTSFIHEENCK